MKNKITNLTQALTYTLEGMYDSEKKIQRDLPDLTSSLAPGALKKLLSQYLETSQDRRLKLKRIFSYLLAGPFGRKSKVTAKAFEEMTEALKMSRPSFAREVLVIAAFDSFVQSRLSTYMMAARMAAQMELDPVAELLDQIMEWEKQSLHQLNKIATKKIGLLQKESLTLAA